MKQVAQRYRTGDLTLVDVPVPMCAPGGVLVRTEYSLISPGTELMKVEEAGRSMLGKARARPDQVRRVLDTVTQQGPHAAFKKVMNQLDSYTPLGYSLCGTVVEVGDGVTDLVVGQRVACAGNQFALHSELNWIPVNLCAVVPDEVDFPPCSVHDGRCDRAARPSPSGARARRGRRRHRPRVDRPAARPASRGRRRPSSGHRHLRREVPARRGDGRRLSRRPPRVARGAHRARWRRSPAAPADAVFLAAGGTSNEPVEIAARVARDRARVIDIGKCSLDLPGAPTTRRSSMFASRGPTGRDATTRSTSSPASTIRSATSAGPRAATSSASWTWWRGAASARTARLGVVPFADAVATYERMRRESWTASASCSSTRPTFRSLASPTRSPAGASADGRSDGPGGLRRCRQLRRRRCCSPSWPSGATSRWRRSRRPARCPV